MYGLDTNVLVRFLVKDDPKQASLAVSFINSHCSTERPCFINQIVLAEMVWVLKAKYLYSREQIAYVIESLLAVGQLKVENSAVVFKALNDYRNSGEDFPDSLIARINQSENYETTITFDKKAAKSNGFKLLK